METLIKMNDYSSIKLYGYDHKYQVGQLVKYLVDYSNKKSWTIGTIATNTDIMDNKPVYDLDNGLIIYEEQIIKVIK